MPYRTSSSRSGSRASRETDSDAGSVAGSVASRSSRMSKKRGRKHESPEGGGVLHMLAQSVVGGGTFSSASGSTRKGSRSGRDGDRHSILFSASETLSSLARGSRKFGGKNQQQNVMGNIAAAAQLPDDALVVVQKNDPHCLSVAAWQSPLTGWCDQKGLIKPVTRGSAWMSEALAPPSEKRIPYLNNRPPVRNKVERYHIQEAIERERREPQSQATPTSPNSRNASPTRGSACAAQAPLATGAFLAQHVINISASSVANSTHLATNMQQQTGSQWCSRALEPNTQVLAALAARDSPLSELGHRSMNPNASVSSGVLSGTISRSAPPSSQLPAASPAASMSLRGTKQLGESLKSRTRDTVVDEKQADELKPDVDPYESRAEWVEVCFRTVMLLGCFVIKWGRHHAEKYTILIPAEHGGETDRYPYWLTSVLAPAYTLPGENTDGKWNVVHAEMNGQGGTDVIRFIGGPVCCRRLRIRMTKPGDIAGRKLSECFYSICTLGAIPFHAPGLGIGLRAEYFKEAPTREMALHAQPHTSRLEPIRVMGRTHISNSTTTATKAAFDSSGLQGDNLGDGRIGPAPGTDLKQNEQEDEASMELTQLKSPSSSILSVGQSCKPSNVGTLLSIPEPQAPQPETPVPEGIASDSSLNFASFTGWLKINQSGSYVISLGWPEAGGVGALACAEYVEESLTPVVKQPEPICGGGYKYKPAKSRIKIISDDGDEGPVSRRNRYTEHRGSIAVPAGQDLGIHGSRMSGTPNLHIGSIREHEDLMTMFSSTNNARPTGSSPPLIVHLWVNLDPIIPEGADEEGDDFHGELLQGQEPLRFAMKLHSGCHALIIETEISSPNESSGRSLIPGLMLSYSGPDTGDIMIPVPPDILAPPAIADASLDSVYVKPGATNGLMGFDPSCREHSLPLLPYEVEQVVFSACAARPWGRIYLMSGAQEGEIETDERRLFPGVASEPLNLLAGESCVYIRVVAPDLRTRATYTIRLARDTWRNCQLQELSVSAPSCLGYVCYRTFDVPKDGAQDTIAIPELPYMALTATVTATTRNQSAFIYIAKGPSKHRLEDEENLGKSGEPHKPIPLHVGRNIIYVRVLSPDHQLTLNWTIVINRHASSDATLKVISIEPCGFRKFLPSADNYQVGDALPSATHEVAVWVEANHDDAKLYVGANDPRRCAIKRGMHRFDHRYQVGGMRVGLRVGWNTIFIRVVAMDSTTSKTYAFQCMRRPMPLLEGLYYLGARLKLSAAIGEVPVEFYDDEARLGGSRRWGTSCVDLDLQQKQARTYGDMPEPMWRVPLKQLQNFSENQRTSSKPTSEEGQRLDESQQESPWLRIRFGSPLMIVGVRVHWKNKIAPRFKVLLRGQTPEELARFPKGETPIFISGGGDVGRKTVYGGGSIGRIGMKRNSIMADVTPSGWRVEHKSEKLSDVTDRTSDMPKLTDIWRTCCIGEGTKPVVLPEPFCATELRIDLIAPYCGEEDLVANRIELVPLSISKLNKQVGHGFIGEFFFTSPQQLHNGLPPDLSALEPALDGSDANTLSMRMPFDYQDIQEAWAAQYVGILDVRDPGLYTFWVETKRFRNDQTLVWRFSVDGKVLMPRVDSNSLSSRYQGSSRVRLGKKIPRRNSDKTLRTISDRSNSGSECEFGRESGSTPPDQDERCSNDFNDRGSRSSRMSVTEDVAVRKSARIRGVTGINLSSQDSMDLSKYDRPKPKGLDFEEEELSGSAEDLLAASGMSSGRSSFAVGRLSRSPSVHSHHSHSSSQVHQLGITKKVAKNSKSRRWMTVNCIAAMSQGSAIPSGMEVMLVPGGHHLRIEVLTQVHSSQGVDVFEETPRRSASKNSVSANVPRVDCDDLDTGGMGDTSVKMNLAYCGPDTSGHVIVVPSTNVAPPPSISAGPDLYTNLLLPTAPLLVTTEIAESWNQASGTMTQWLEEEIFLEQLHGLSIHSIEQEDHFQGACQVAAIHNRTLHGTVHLRGLRYKEWQYSTNRVPESVLETAAQYLSSPTRRFVGIASASDAVYDASHMKQVLPNVLVVWYLDQDASTEPIAQGKGRRKSAREAIRATLFKRTTQARNKFALLKAKTRNILLPEDRERFGRTASGRAQDRETVAGGRCQDKKRDSSDTESATTDIFRHKRSKARKTTAGSIASVRSSSPQGSRGKRMSFGCTESTVASTPDHATPELLARNDLSIHGNAQGEDHPRTVMYQSGVCRSADEVIHDVTRWLRKRGLRKGDVLGFTVHPVREPGTPKQSRSDKSEKCEWVVFYIVPGEDHARVITAGGRTPLVAVQGFVLQTQKSWNWHFNQLTSGEMSAQGLVACTTTTIMREGRSECLQLVLWQSPVFDGTDLDAPASRSASLSGGSLASSTSEWRSIRGDDDLDVPIHEENSIHESSTSAPNHEMSFELDARGEGHSESPEGLDIDNISGEGDETRRESSLLGERRRESSLELDMDIEGDRQSSEEDLDLDGESSVARYRQMLLEAPQPLIYRPLVDLADGRASTADAPESDAELPVVSTKAEGARSLDTGTLEVFFCYDFDQNVPCMTWEWHEKEEEKKRQEALRKAEAEAAAAKALADAAAEAEARGSALKAARAARHKAFVMANDVVKEFLTETLFPKALANIATASLLSRRTYPAALRIERNRARRLARRLLWNWTYPLGAVLTLE